MKRTIFKKVKFKGDEYWLASCAPFSHLNLSPLNHYDEQGNLLAEFDAISFAIVESDGVISRFGIEIGKITDLEDVK